ncbi:MAG: DNA mismatch repair protein MutS, partial [Lachnospiraceae bacterium]|nr:DNA mismatch repair protein MutS [Lachnospiraceae bacterium]
NKRDGADIRGIVITGPNTGGKTVAIKTVALNCMMAQCGLHVAAEEACICMNSSFLCDIGDGQNLSENLSTFSAHITNVLDILRKVNSDSLVIMDELGSGTDPTEGMGIAIAILKELKKSGALFLVTTHYPEVKQYAEQEENVINARMTFDRESLRPLYQMIIGEAGESCALYIARQLGMPDAMLRNAVEAAYGKSTQEILTILSEENEEMVLQRESVPRIQKCKKESRKQEAAGKFCLGDSVMVYPDRKIGIVCQKANEKGVLRVQMPDKKIWINHKRVKLYIKAEELYPEDYDFSILFDTVSNRKLRHQMEKRHVEGEEIAVIQ